MVVYKVPLAYVLIALIFSVMSFARGVIKPYGPLTDSIDLIVWVAEWVKYFNVHKRFEFVYVMVRMAAHKISTNVHSHSIRICSRHLYIFTFEQSIMQYFSIYNFMRPKNENGRYRYYT